MEVPGRLYAQEALGGPKVDLMGRSRRSFRVQVRPALRGPPRSPAVPCRLSLRGSGRACGERRRALGLSDRCASSPPSLPPSRGLHPASSPPSFVCSIPAAPPLCLPPSLPPRTPACCCPARPGPPPDPRAWRAAGAGWGRGDEPEAAAAAEEEEGGIPHGPRGGRLGPWGRSWDLPTAVEESPSTASTTPDSTDGGNDESDFPELQTAREFSEDEEEASVEWGTPRELTFSYITIAGGASSSPPLGDHGPRGRRDSQTRRTRAPLPHTETCETFVPALGDSLENIPSLCPSPEGEGAPPPGHCQGLDPFSGWDAHLACASEPDTAEGEGAHVSPPHSPVTETLEGEQSSSESSSDISPEDLLPPEALAPPPAEGAPCDAETIQHQARTSSELCEHLLLDEEMGEEEEEEERGQELTADQLQTEPDQSGNTLGICILEASGAEERSQVAAVFTLRGPSWDQRFGTELMLFMRRTPGSVSGMSLSDAWRAQPRSLTAGGGGAPLEGPAGRGSADHQHQTRPGSP
ncbi:uncharacterized protein [Tiliqua scincoides]|uniref:uncharacterized protein n=1 Tax=Tiliqua scincoides TaxID=71010 RepID=UPI003461A571